MATSDKTYNGWTNYETWNVALWIDNEEGSYRYWRDVAQEVLDDNDGDRDDAKSDLTRRLEDEIKEGAPDLGSSCYSDLLSAALSEVNWYEIAGNWIDEIEVDETEESDEEGGGDNE